MTDKGNKAAWQLLGLTAAIAGLFYYASTQVKVKGIGAIDKFSVAKRNIADQLLAIANSYEPKRRSYLKNIRYDMYGENEIRGRWSGSQHDYTAFSKIE
jgi:hypothetical protein